ncbi:MAG: CDP-alcohol phosphatidyltransferase family protein [Chloroflexi bacterium]|nr:CDP-alcohol phosphatidyltransferase family protein [Chloroflexota bacterium]
MAGIYVLKPAFQRSLGGIERWLVARRVHPDWLTGAALALSVVGGICLYAAPVQPWLLAAVPLVAVVRTALNALDGLVARDTGLARPWGEVLNELSDRLADVALLGGMAFAGPADLRLGAAAIVAMLISSYLAILSKAAGGRRQYMGPMGKADRMALLAVVGVLGLVLPLEWVYSGFLAIVLVGCMATLVRRLQATYADLHPTSAPRQAA